MEARFAKQTRVFQKTLFENTFNAMAMIQDQTEIIVSGYLDQLPWMSEDAKKSLKHSGDLGKKSLKEFKKAVEDGYRKYEEVLEQQADLSQSQSAEVTKYKVQPQEKEKMSSKVLKRDVSGKCEEGECRDRVSEGNKARQVEIEKENIKAYESYPAVPDAEKLNNPDNPGAPRIDPGDHGDRSQKKVSAPGIARDRQSKENAPRLPGERGDGC